MLTKKQFTTLTILLIGVVLTAAVFAGPALAFKPNDGGHLGISSEALTVTQRVVDGETLRFSEKAVKEIRDANRATDIPFGFTSENHFDNELFDFNTNRLINLKRSIIQKITAASPDGASARKDLGGALHTLQDFYSHSNWVEIGNTGIDTRLGRSTFGALPLSVATCPDNPGTLGGAGLTSLTSGYFKINTPAGKCRHGSTFFNGINKDDSSRPNYAAARRVAVEATKDYVNQILDAPGVAGNAKAIKALMDIRGTLGVIIDDTGSMQPVINQVKSQVAHIVSDVVGTEREPDEYMLVRFGDPDVGTPLVTSDANAFLAAVNGLSAGGGGDCPELSQSALLAAVGASRSDSTLFLFTDADAKDAALGAAVNAAAQEKRTKITPILNGACGSGATARAEAQQSHGFDTERIATQQAVGSVYHRNAEETGGQLFVLDSSEVSRTFELVRPQLTGNFVSILSASGTLGSADSVFDIPIDSSVTDATFSVTTDGGNDISLRRPSGALVTASEPNVKVTNLSSGTIIGVVSPEPGLWKVEIAGQGAFTVSATATSQLQLASFNFVALEEETIDGESRHSGYYPIEGQPLIGSPQTGLADLTGTYSTADFTLLAQNGQALQRIALAPNHPDAGADEFVGTFEPPPEPFRVAVSGVDGNGVPYQRLFPALFQAQSIQVSVDADSTVSSLSVGQPTVVRFTVRNLGPAGSFGIVAGNSENFPTNPEPRQITLASNATGSIAVVIHVPNDAAAGTEVVLTTAVSSLSDASLTNSASITLVTTVKGYLPAIGK